MLGGAAAGCLIGSVLLASLSDGVEAGGLGLGDLLVLAWAVVLSVMFVRRRHAARMQPLAVAVPGGEAELPDQPTVEGVPDAGSDFDRGVRDIRRADRGFDPARFAGYAAMVYRDVHGAWTAGDVGPVRDRLTPEMFEELRRQRAELRSIGLVNRVEEIEIRADITEAWQEKGQDYVTAYLAGSMLDYTVDEVTGTLAGGSRTVPSPVAAFWTFTRLAGLNPWMLSAIQTK